MDSTEIMSIDSLLKELGDCGLFQVLIVLVVWGASIVPAFGITFMAFGNYNPGWHCNDTWLSDRKISNLTGNGLWTDTNASRVVKLQSSCSVYDVCDVIYNDDSSTIVTEWNLICDRTWISSFIISLQMFGYFLGTVLASILDTRLGRKLTHCLGLILNIAFNLIAMLSVNWPMFALFRLLIGTTSGIISITCFVYPVEFLTSKWRAIVSALPFYNIGSILFGVCALVLRDWNIMHLVTAILSAVFLFLTLWFPESIRWLAVNGQTDKAMAAVRSIVRLNRKTPENVEVARVLSEQKKCSVQGSKKKTLMDIYRNGYWKRTSVLAYTWICAYACFSILNFGLTSLSGDFYINLILFNLIPTVILPFLPFLSNTVGRKWSLSVVLGLGSLCSVTMVALDFTTSGTEKGVAVVVLTFVLFTCMEAADCLAMLSCVELYPTSIRSLGYSYGHCLGRIGGAISPFLVPHDHLSLVIAHIVMAALILADWVSVFQLPETKGLNMADYDPLDD